MKTLAVRLWPGAAPTPEDGLFAILVRTGTGMPRADARIQLRAAACEALAAVLGGAVGTIGDIRITSAPGQPPRVLLAGSASGIGCSFSYDKDYALAALNLQGAIGADLMRVQDIPDWHTVARDYLGPRVAAALHTAADRPRAYTQEWTEREAALKYHAQQISEWQADLPGRSISLALPVANLLGHIHIGDKRA